MIACTRGSGATPHTVLPPAAVSAVRVPREWPEDAGLRGVDAIRKPPGQRVQHVRDVPDAVGDAVRHAGLRAVAGTERRTGGGSPSLQLIKRGSRPAG